MSTLLRRLTIVTAFLCLITAIGLLTAVVSNEATVQAKQTLVAQAQENVFKVTDGSTRSGGTGFLLDAEEFGKIIVTNRHVCEVADPDGYILLLQAERMYWSKIIAKSDRTDLCLIYAPKEVKSRSDGYKYASRKLHINQEIIVFGHPWLSPLKQSGGYFTNTVITYFNPSDFFDESSGVLMHMGRLTVHISPGNSGSPVLNSDGELVGIIFAYEVMTGKGLMVPVEALKEFVNEVVY